MTQTRVPLVERDQAGLLVRHLYPEGREPSNLTKTLANAPDTFAVLAPFLGQVMNASTIDEATKEVVVLRVSALNACGYCIPTHRVVAREAGLDQSEVEALSDAGAAMPPGTSAEAHGVVAELCDRLVRDANAVDEVLIGRLRVHFGDHEIVELVTLAGAITMLNYIASAFAIPVDPRTLAALGA